MASLAENSENLATVEAALHESISIFRQCGADGEPHAGELADSLCMLGPIYQDLAKAARLAS